MWQTALASAATSSPSTAGVAYLTALPHMLVTLDHLETNEATRAIQGDA
jgi:hypothetical protein